MTDHPRHRCVVCQTELPPLTRAEALQKGAATVIDGLTFYHCIGRHSAQEIMDATVRRPAGFVRAGSCK